MLNVSVLCLQCCGEKSLSVFQVKIARGSMAVLDYYSGEIDLTLSACETRDEDAALRRTRSLNADRG